MSFSEICETVEEVKDTIDDWERTYGVGFSKSFNVTGGEPFLREDLFKILEVMGGHDFEIFVLSNGVLIDKTKAEGLSALGVKGVQVSLEGPEEVHDRIRGKGSFARSMKGVGHLISSGLTVTLNVTLSNLNAPYISELVALARDAGAPRLGFSRLVPCGRGRQLQSEMMDKNRVRDIYRFLLSVQAEGLEIVTGDPVASQMELKSNTDMGYTACSGCAAGISGLTLRPDGTINPCRRLDIPVGNIRTDSLREVWATSEVLNSLRDKSRYGGKCGACARWAVCRGCRAVAYAYSRLKGGADFLAEDPQCFIEE